MARYIDADSARQTIDFEGVFSTEQALRIIDGMPTVDAVLVVRCKDCKHDGSCLLESFVADNSVEPFDAKYWFCPDGERKDG